MCFRKKFQFFPKWPVYDPRMPMDPGEKSKWIINILRKVIVEHLSTGDFGGSSHRELRGCRKREPSEYRLEAGDQKS